MQLRVLAFVLAGGKGTRLYPLTKERAKPAVPFGGRYRIVDFVLSNLINSGIFSVYVLTQFKSQSLLQHLREGWEVTGLLKNHFIIPVPAQMRTPEEDWYRGTADAIHQNINLIEQADPHVVVIFGADHIYRMNIRQMIEFHVERRAGATIAAIPVARELATEFGVIETKADGSVVGFHEKRADAPTMPDDPHCVFASMGNYIFSTGLLLKELYADAQNPNSSHDFGKDILEPHRRLRAVGLREHDGVERHLVAGEVAASVAEGQHHGAGRRDVTAVARDQRRRRQGHGARAQGPGKAVPTRTSNCHQDIPFDPRRALWGAVPRLEAATGETFPARKAA